MGLRKRLKMYIKDDRPLKLKSFIKSHDLNVRKVKLNSGRSLLHYCAVNGSPDMLRCLLQLDCDASLQDKAGMLPLHAALYRALGEDAKDARETYMEMVCPLLEAYPMGQDVEDLDHKTGQDLLSSLKQRLKTNSLSEKKRWEKEEKEHQEVEWRKKLAREQQIEFEEQLPHSSFMDDYGEGLLPETFSDWSDRIYREYTAKQQSKNSSMYQAQNNYRKRKSSLVEGLTPSSPKASKTESYSETDDDPLHKAREEMRNNYKPPPVQSISTSKLLDQKKMYELKYSRFARNALIGKPIRFGMVPWPCANLDMLVDVLFCDLKNKESSDYQKYLKMQRIRWHPDKFSQKFKSHLHPDHVIKIMSRVNVISQTLNALTAV